MATNYVADNFRGSFHSFVFYRNKEFCAAEIKIDAIAGVEHGMDNDRNKLLTFVHHRHIETISLVYVT
jgi:hypothetical protein